MTEFFTENLDIWFGGLGVAVLGFVFSQLYLKFQRRNEPKTPEVTDIQVVDDDNTSNVSKSASRYSPNGIEIKSDGKLRKKVKISVTNNTSRASVLRNLKFLVRSFNFTDKNLPNPRSSLSFAKSYVKIITDFRAVKSSKTLELDISHLRTGNEATLKNIGISLRPHETDAFTIYLTANKIREPGTYYWALQGVIETSVGDMGVPEIEIEIKTTSDGDFSAHSNG